MYALGFYIWYAILGYFTKRYYLRTCDLSYEMIESYQAKSLF